jgi:arylsulfatase A-like enzyme
MPEQSDRRIDRRTFLKAGLAGGVALGAGAGIWAATQGGGPSARAGAPNILVILVDQMRYPQWFSAAHRGVGLPPHLAELRRGAVSFAHHYTASNDCTPARSALLTGLYTHQTGCLLTGASTLHPGFPTWGSMLREQGYRTFWYGKWHLTHHDSHWTPAVGAPILDGYGFGGGTYPSPNGAPGQGLHTDPKIVGQFEDWFAAEGAGAPWCTTVSLVNPHDIAWWYKRTRRVPAEASARHVVRALPPNFETPAALIARHKPRLQLSLQETSAQSFGPVPFTGPRVAERWLPFLDLYVKLQHEVDGQIGRVLRALHSNPEVAAKTVIVFTADHGEYAGSHGLRGKGGGVYDEGIRVPLIVKDPTGTYTRAPHRVRSQLTSSVDVAPLLLTIASGSDRWRQDPRYAHIAGRLALERLLGDPHAHGRPYVLHATDELISEFADELYAANAPLHVVALRTHHEKYATYSEWPAHGTEVLAARQERELYDYRTRRGRLELDNVAGRHPFEGRIHALLERAIAHELRAQLPDALTDARDAGFEDYFALAKKGVIMAGRRRASRARRRARQRARRRKQLQQQHEQQHQQQHPKHHHKPAQHHKQHHAKQHPHRNAHHNRKKKHRRSH